MANYFFIGIFFLTALAPTSRGASHQADETEYVHGLADEAPTPSPQADETARPRCGGARGRENDVSRCGPPSPTPSAEPESVTKAWEKFLDRLGALDPGFGLGSESFAGDPENAEEVKSFFDEHPDRDCAQATKRATGAIQTAEMRIVCREGIDFLSSSLGAKTKTERKVPRDAEKLLYDQLSPADKELFDRHRSVLRENAKDGWGLPARLVPEVRKIAANRDKAYPVYVRSIAARIAELTAAKAATKALGRLADRGVNMGFGDTKQYDEELEKLYRLSARTALARTPEDRERIMVESALLWKKQGYVLPMFSDYLFNLPRLAER